MTPAVAERRPETWHSGIACHFTLRREVRLLWPEGLKQVNEIGWERGISAVGRIMIWQLIAKLALLQWLSCTAMMALAVFRTLVRLPMTCRCIQRTGYVSSLLLAALGQPTARLSIGLKSGLRRSSSLLRTLLDEHHPHYIMLQIPLNYKSRSRA